MGLLDGRWSFVGLGWVGILVPGSRDFGQMSGPLCFCANMSVCDYFPKEMNAAGQTCTNDRRKRFAEGRRTTAPMAIVTRGKTLSLATKNAPNLEADPGTRAPSKSSPGVSSLFVIVWQRLWIIGAHNLIRRITHDCLSCFLQCYHTAQQQMVDLPIVRVTQALPFVNTGCDYAGPIFLKDPK